MVIEKCLKLSQRIGKRVLQPDLQRKLKLTKIGFKGPCLEKISSKNKQILYGFQKFKVNKKGFQEL